MTKRVLNAADYLKMAELWEYGSPSAEHMAEQATKALFLLPDTEGAAHWAMHPEGKHMIPYDGEVYDWSTDFGSGLA